MIENVVIWQTLIVLSVGVTLIGFADLMFYWSRLRAALLILGVVLAAAGVFLWANPNLF